MFSLLKGIQTAILNEFNAIQHYYYIIAINTRYVSRYNKNIKDHFPLPASVLPALKNYYVQ